MKTNLLQKLAIAAIAGMTLSASTALAQESPANIAAQPAAVAAPAPKLPDGVSQIMQLVQAKLGDDTIIAFVKNSGNSYALDAGQIIWLRQHGVSDAVITTMLTQPKPTVTYISPTMPAPPPAAPVASAMPVSTVSVAPAVTYVQPSPVVYYQTAPAPTYYYERPYYPAYNYEPALSFGLGLGLGWGLHGGWGHGGHR
jgi:hypothetical protein